MTTKLSVLILSIFVVVNSEEDQCGISVINSGGPTGLIYNGELAQDGQWPWAAALYLKDGNSRKYYCTGTLISDRFVLTAAHCIQNKGQPKTDVKKISITLGASDTSNNNGEIFDVIEVKNHPDWNPVYGTKYDADIAIIKLRRTVKFSDKIRPACLPSSHEKVFEVTGFVAGYGVSNGNELDGKLRYLKIPTVTQENCLWHPNGFIQVASNRTFCGGDLKKSACKGDSGAGFVVRSSASATFKIVGIVSASILGRDENCSPNSYVVFTNVPLFVNWVLAETERMEEISYEVWNHYNPYDPLNDKIPENSIFVPEGEVLSYVARRKTGNDLLIGKYIPNWKLIYLPYHGGELKFGDDIELLSTSKMHQWIPFTGSIPSNAVHGGYERSSSVLVGRRWHEGQYIIGKIIEDTKKIYVSHFSKEFEFDEFEILVLGDEFWLPYNSSSNSTLNHAVPSNEGYIRTYVARRKIENNLIVGKFVPTLKSIFVQINGEQQKFEDGIEILNTNKKYQWIPFTGSFPSNAVQGGYENKTKLYVGLKKYAGYYKIGKVTEDTKTIFFDYGSIEKQYKNSFEILVLLS